MKSIIEQFYWGEVIPCEFPSPKSEKYKEAVSSLEETEKAFLEKFPDCEQELVQYRDQMQKTAALEGACDFVNGFRLGATFMLDILNSSN